MLWSPVLEVFVTVEYTLDTKATEFLLIDGAIQLLWKWQNPWAMESCQNQLELFSIANKMWQVNFQFTVIFIDTFTVHLWG